MKPKTEAYIRFLSRHADPIIRWRTKQALLSGYASSEITEARNDLAHSPIIQGLLRDKQDDGGIRYHPYDKWFGAHWVLYLLADLGYPAGEEALKPLLEQCYAWLLSKEHAKHIREINGRTRRCASQEGNCIYYSLVLGLADQRTQELAERLIKWQWEDGGWNCDKRPDAAVSSFNETLIPLRGLAHYATISDDSKIRLAVDKAAQVFLKRQLIYRMRDERIIDQHFIKLHYPNYWHYDYLFALKVMAEAGYIDDPRCKNALDILEGKQLPDGGFPAEERYYHVDEKKLSGHSRVDFGGTSNIRSNPFVSLDALIVLKKSGRLVL